MFITKKNLLNGLLLTASLSLSLQAAVTTQGLKQYFDYSVKAETALYLGTAGAIELARFTEPAKGQPGYGDANQRVVENLQAGTLAMHIAGKASDVVGSALELPQSLKKNCSRAWLVSIATAAGEEHLLMEQAKASKKPEKSPDLTFAVRVVSTGVIALDTLLFNKVNELVNNRFPGAHLQTKRRVVRVVSMAAARYFMYLFVNLATEVMMKKNLLGPVPSGNEITSIDSFSRVLLLSKFGKATVDHILTECAGAALAQLIDDSQATAAAPAA